MFSLYALILCFTAGYGLIMPMVKPDGSLDVSSLLSHIALLEQTIESNTPETETRDLKSQLTVALADLKATQIKVAVMESQLNSQHSQCQCSAPTVTQPSTDISRMKADVLTLKTDVFHLQSQQNLTQQARDEQNISFLVRLSSSITPSANSIIKFPVVIQNLGNAYNTSTGRFTAPVSGIYLFHISAVAKDEIHVDLVMDGDLLATAYGYGVPTDDQGSNMAVVHMRKDQRIWARFMRGHLRVIADGYTQFTGALLRQD